MPSPYISTGTVIFASTLPANSFSGNTAGGGGHNYGTSCFNYVGGAGTFTGSCS